MSKQDIKNLPVLIQDRLLNQAKDSGKSFYELLQYYAIERFLYRLAQSKYASQFVLKGALLFRVWGLSAYRPTRTIDLLGYTNNEVENLVATIKEVCDQKVQDDGFWFDAKTVVGKRVKEDADYESVQVRLVGFLGKTRVHLQINIGFEDVITPAPVVKSYSVILPMPAPELRTYPPETVVAEKLQAMIYLGTFNSRIKDFYDLWAIANWFEFTGDVLQEAIHQTFERRDTDIPRYEPAAFSAQFARDQQSQWRAFLKTSGITDAPDQLEVVLICLREFIDPVFESSRAGRKFEKRWKAGELWE